MRVFVSRVLIALGIADAWEMGTCNGRPARRHRANGNVQFVLWKAGEQGHEADFWHDFDRSWWIMFEPTK